MYIQIIEKNLEKGGDIARSCPQAPVDRCRCSSVKEVDKVQV